MSTFSQINTNIQSQQAFQNLQDTSEELATRRERLTTGLRINSASDDAAGFQIANQLEAKTSAQGQALRNIGDAKSTLSTAEGALDSQLSILQTAKEKATQAANGSLSQDERDAIAGELNQLGQEINDIQENATFNDKQLLSGDGSGNSKTFNFQTGAGSSDGEGQFSVDLESSGTSDLGIGGNLDLSTDSGKEDALSVDQGDFKNSEGPGNLDSALQSESDATSDSAGASTSVQATLDGSDLKGDLEGGEFNISVTDPSTGDSSLQFQVEKEGEITNTKTVNVGGDDSTVELESANGGSNTIELNASNVFKKDDVGSGETKEFSVEVTDGQLGDRLKGDSGSTEARNIISDIDSAIDTVSSNLSDIGAQQNRLSFKESNLETQKTNLSAAQSRIEDADFAKEQTRVAKLQVQQQSGTAQLAQANAAGQSVLSLLQ